MMCPVCKRELAPTLSICLTCGAMMNDTVREELETKISSNSGDLVPTPSLKLPPRPEFLVSKDLPKVAEPEKRAAPRTVTAQLPNKNTSQTLVDFQNKNAMLPDWRLQLQNAVDNAERVRVRSARSKLPRSRHIDLRQWCECVENEIESSREP